MRASFQALNHYKSTFKLDSNCLMFFLWLSFFILPVNSICQERDIMTNINQHTFRSPFDVPIGYRSETNYSPVINNQFFGIKINSPEKITVKEALKMDRFGNNDYVPISLTHQFNLAYLRKFNNITDHMTVVAVNVKTGISFSGNLGDEDTAEYPDDAPYLPEEELVNTFAEGFLTFNLLQVLNLPAESAAYFIHVTLEEYQSNVLQILLVRME